jgi:hypothetical protein
MEPVVISAPRFVQNGSESLGLKALENFDVGISEKKKNRWKQYTYFFRQKCLKNLLTC